jgi:hypothetical protein
MKEEGVSFMGLFNFGGYVNSIVEVVGLIHVLAVFEGVFQRGVSKLF